MMDVFRFRRRGGLWLFAAVFLAYMLSMSRERPWADATPLWELADSMAVDGSIAIHTRWPGNLAPGRGGKIYAVAPILQGIMHMPGALLQRLAHTHIPKQAELAWRINTHLATGLLGALTCVLFFGLCRRLGVKPTPAALTTVALAFATTIWVYARYPYSEALQAACFTGFFAQLLTTRADPARRNGALLGLWAGLLINAKYIYLASVTGGVIYLVWALRGQWRALLETAVAALVAALPLAAMILLYNYARWGSCFTSGYDLSSQVGIRENVAVGLWGMFLSPGKSVFLYSPPLLAGLVGLPRAVRRWPRFLPAVLWVLLPPLLINARLVFWSGDYAWGPRYVVFAVPVMLLPASLVVEDCLAAAWGWRRILTAGSLAALLVTGGFVQYLGNAFYWDHFIRIQREAAHFWLGRPNARGSGMIETGVGCGACFEDMHPTQWLPPFQPILGHYWMLRHVRNDDNWVVAEKDAPWHRYTTLQINISSTWPRARIDWWFPEFREINPTISWIMVLALPLLCLLGFFFFFREVWLSARMAERPTIPRP